MDDFESQLSQQKIRGVPSHWKKQILATAAQAAAQSSPEAQPAVAWSWRDLLWPCPQVWAGFAAAWLLVLFLNVAVKETSTPNAMASRTIPAPLDGYEERQRLMAEILGDTRKQPIPSFVPRRRSEVEPDAVTV
jgi:hypothetical protein